jgi:hypothetical protein
MAMTAASCCGTPAASSEIKTLAGKAGRVVIQVSGQIEPGDADLFVAAVKRADAAGKDNRNRSAELNGRPACGRRKARRLN